jgi:Cellulose binding domain
MKNIATKTKNILKRTTKTTLTLISIIALALGITATPLITKAKTISLLDSFTYGVSVESEAIPTTPRLVSGPWVVGDWRSNNSQFLGQFSSTANSNKIPYQYLYVVAGKARTDWGLQDCNVGYPVNQTLCYNGANYIRSNKEFINNSYISIANNIKNTYGVNKDIVLHIEPDFYQYTNKNQNGGGLSYAEAHSIMNQWTTSIKSILPNSALVLDISPWNKDLANWSAGFRNYDYAGMVGKRFSPYGDGTVAAGIDGQTYKSMSTSTAKKLIIDDSHGVGGAWLGFNYDWGNTQVVQSRISDGIIAVLQPPNDNNTLSNYINRNTLSNTSINTSPITTPTSTSTVCNNNSATITLTKSVTWSNGFNGVLKIKNNSNAPIYYWKTVLNLSPDQKINNVWNVIQYGTNELDPNVSWNKTIQPYQELEVGGASINYASNSTLPTISCNIIR